MKRVASIVLWISLLGNAALLYRLFDLGVTTTYGADEISRRNQQAAQAEKLVPLLLQSTSRAEVLSAAQKADLEVLEKGEDGLYVGSIHFVFVGDQVAAVSFE